MKHLLIGITLLIFSFTVHATVYYGAINNVTKEYTSLNTNSLYTPIGWKSVGEKNSERLSEYAESICYSYTDFPYKIECYLLAFIVLGLLLFRAKNDWREY
jgi:hypothetical protein